MRPALVLISYVEFGFREGGANWPVKESYTAQDSLELKLPSGSSPPFYAKQLSPKEKNGH